MLVRFTCVYIESCFHSIPSLLLYLLLFAKLFIQKGISLILRLVYNYFVWYFLAPLFTLIFFWFFQPLPPPGNYNPLGYLIFWNFPTPLIIRNPPFIWHTRVVPLTIKRYSSFLKRFSFSRKCFKVKALKTFKFSTDCHIKTCRSLKRKALLILSTVF